MLERKQNKISGTFQINIQLFPPTTPEINTALGLIWFTEILGDP